MKSMDKVKTAGVFIVLLCISIGAHAQTENAGDETAADTAAQTSSEGSNADTAESESAADTTQTSSESSETSGTSDEVSSSASGDVQAMEDGGGEEGDPYLNEPVVTAESPLGENNGFFQTSLFTGSASYIYEIDVPPGTNGLAPRVTLSYNSHSARGRAGEAGAGWTLDTSYIQRDVEYTPDDTSDDTFDLVLNGQSFELIYVSAEGRYHTKTESYLYIKYSVKNPLESIFHHRSLARVGMISQSLMTQHPHAPFYRCL